MPQVKAIIGLGNPGDNYAATRHNAGAWLVEILARQAGTELRTEKKFLGLYAKVQLDGQELHLLEPTTFMNRSGGAVAALCQFFKIAPGELLVAHDELDLPPGTARYKQGGGHGGHNGLRDIISALGDKDFNRLRIGIGHPGDSRQVTNYVLGRPGKSELEAIGAALDESLATLPLVMTGEWARAMSRLHSFKA
ncbi:MAG: aminoacyl-tRNA hydrolase [Halomonas sp.]|uniref:Peptidyl-tRNA hydrolase n=2 Tax=Halomonadaceae TaxID=28256 RepID=A0ABS6ZNL6_9GAMM|nr:MULTISPECIES: aminoacyl-tRNA hydrolase [Halomonas]MBW6391651.1 aminoacyl-tRNA hydrolase [Halomonas antri]MDX5377187.1 aminoacyl-tRNA hydrolase [Halomonas sp.]MDX5502743.1 aminoacyl-tRNA hydrolase [Halomonas sp.]QTP59758.1 aminoacyl-tRNA hydrolase [Halomonas sulfidivorans]